MAVQKHVLSQPQHTIVFVVPPRVHLLDLSGPAHIFYEAGDYGAPVQLRFVQLANDAAVQSTAGLSFAALEPFDQYELAEGDVIFIPGLEASLLTDAAFLASAQPFLQWLQRQYRQGATVASVCTGAFLLAASGLLNGRPCTTHWKFFSRFESTFPHVTLLKNRLFVAEDNIYTSAGVSSGIDLALYLLEKQHGAAFAASIAREVVLYMRRGPADPQLSIFMQYRNHLDERIHTVQDWLTQHIHEKITIGQLAELAFTSPRHLTRLFRQTTGITIAEYREQLQVARALQMLKEQHKITETAQACGFKSTNQLRNLLKKHQGQLPSFYLNMA